MLIIIPGASALLVKFINGALLGVSSWTAVVSSRVLAADVAADPGLGAGDLFSVASKEGLALLISVMFIGGVMTRRIIIADPSAVSDLATVNKSLGALMAKVDEVTNSMARIELFQNSVGEPRMENIEKQLDRINDRMSREQRE